MIWWVYCVSPSVCLCVVVQACNHPSMYSTIMSSSACNLCTMESCYCYCWCWCWCRWLDLPHMQACKHARSLSGRPYRRNHCKAMAWAGMPAAVRPKVAFLLVFYPLLESSRCRKTLFVWFSINVRCNRTLRHLFRYILKSDSMLYLDVHYLNVYKTQI